MPNGHTEPLRLTVDGAMVAGAVSLSFPTVTSRRTLLLLETVAKPVALSITSLVAVNLAVAMGTDGLSTLPSV